MTQGLERNRVSMLLAVLDKKLSLGLSGMDAFINVIGGIKVDETAVDLAVLAAVISCIRNKPIRHGVIIFGEVGLTGEIRSVSSIERRVSEAKHMGFDSCILPGACKKAVEKLLKTTDFDMIYVDSLGEMIDILF